MTKERNGNLQDNDEKEKLKMEARRNQIAAEARTGGGARRARKLPMIDLDEQDAE